MSERDPLAPAFEIPDLELEPPAPSKRASAVSAPVSSRQGPSSGAAPQLPLISFDGDDDFDLLESGSSANLAIVPDPLASPRQVETGEWPRGRTPAVDQLRVDAREVALLADYGPPPRNAVSTPLYAFRVFSRRKPLKSALALQHAALAAAELERDTLLMRLASELRPSLEAHEAFKRALEPVREIERLAGERGAALSQADSGYREQMAKFDGELAGLREAEARAKTQTLEREASKTAAESELRRAEAKYQRVQIEIRGVLDLARQVLGPAGGDLPPEHAAKLAELQGRAAALEPDLDQAKAKHGAAVAALREAEAEAQRVRSQIRQLDRQKAGAGAALGKQLNERAAGMTEVEKQLRDALAEVARAVLGARGALPVPETTLAQLREHDKQVEACATRLEMHVRALDSYDRDRARQGVIVVLSVLGVVLLSILLKAML
ncbi:MAG TPA: hypothetical protein VHB79_00050 [Polyangiaceae bacterium]|nr:hypothetical protein [Polyangiaceae bacterium]